MAAKDFRSDRIRTRAIIGTGSVASGKKNLNLMFYSGSHAQDFEGLIDFSTAAIGDDVWLYIHGKPNSVVDPNLKSDASTVLFNGDVVISGTLWSERSVVEVDDSVPGDFKAFNKVIGGMTTAAPYGYKTGYARILVDPTTANPSANRDGTISFNVVPGVDGAWSYATQFPSSYKDVFFHVSGSRGVRNTNDRGLALFDGDIHTSGNLSTGPYSSATFGGSVSIAGDLEVGGDVTILGNDIKDSGGAPAITFDGSQNTELAGDLTVVGNDIKSSAGTVVITLDGANATIGNNLTVNNILKVTSNQIQNDADITSITLGTSVTPTTFAHDIKVGGNNIQGSDGIAALHFSGSGNTTVNKNLTVVGDLNVSGSVVSIGTENLRVKDALILLASGSTTSNTRGGIAIASGSSLANRALVIGAGASNNTWIIGHKDVQDGDVTTVSDAEPLPLQLAGVNFRDHTALTSFSNTYITASIDGGRTDLTINNSLGNIELQPSNYVKLTGDRRFYFDHNESNTSFIKANGGNLYLQAKGLGANGIQLNDTSDKDAKLQFRGSNNYIYAHDDREGLFITGSRSVRVGSLRGTVATGGGEIILSASAQEADGGSVLVVSSSYDFNGATSEGVISLGAALPEVKNLFTNVRHRDVRTILSGAVGTANSNTRGVTLVAGDLVVSGNTNLVGAVDIGSISLENLTLESTSTPGPYINFRDSNVRIRRNGNNLEFDDLNGPSRTLTELASLAVTDNTNVFSVTPGDMAASGIPSFVRTSGSFSFDTGLNPAVGGIRATSTIGTDVYFFVSGSRGDRYSSTRGTAVFGGDMVVSGAMLISAPSSTVPLQIGTSSTSTTAAVAITGSIEIYDPSPGGVPQIVSKTVSSGLALGVATGTALEIDSSANTIAHGTLKMNNNNTLALKDTNRTIHGYLDSGVEKLKIKNANTNGTVVIEANNGSGHLAVTGSILPGADSSYNLGSPIHRWANIYTGDLHLRNERGNWTIYEEPDMLVVVNNLTGKKYKMGLTPLEDKE